MAPGIVFDELRIRRRCEYRRQKNFLRDDLAARSNAVDISTPSATDEIIDSAQLIEIWEADFRHVLRIGGAQRHASGVAGMRRGWPS
jgi:hypothetical protein